MSTLKSAARDLDETRRLLYIALAAGYDGLNTKLSDKAELAGTLANALAHHRGGYTPDDALEFAVSVIKGAGAVKAHSLINAITCELASLEPE